MVISNLKNIITGSFVMKNEYNGDVIFKGRYDEIKTEYKYVWEYRSVHKVKNICVEDGELVVYISFCA